MVFGMIFATGKGSLVRLQDKINASLYKEILKKMYLICEQQLINQLYLCNITLCVT